MKSSLVVVIPLGILWGATMAVALVTIHQYREEDRGRPVWQFCTLENRANNPRVLLLDPLKGETKWVYSRFDPESMKMGCYDDSPSS